MAKSRMLRPDFWTDEKVVQASPLARLLFAGMWNFACDNGHLDDSPLQLKMRILPADNCDIQELLDELLSSGMVVRMGGFLKVVNLSEKQPIDTRFLVFCDHCGDDPDRHYRDEDKKGNRRAPGEATSSTPRAPGEATSSARRSGDGDGDGDGDGSRRRASSKPPKGWAPNDSAAAFASDNQLDLKAEAEQFLNHHLSKGSKFVDWDRAFRTWLGNAKKWAKPKVEPIRPAYLDSPPPDYTNPDAIRMTPEKWQQMLAEAQP